MKYQIKECDDVLKRLSENNKYFVDYANFTKLKTFSNVESAKLFVKGVLNGEYEIQ